MNSMFYLIRINRRDKPHSRTGNDNVAKQNSGLGNKRANFNYKERGPGNSQGGQYRRLQRPEVGRRSRQLGGPSEQRSLTFLHHRQTHLHVSGRRGPV